ncbi:DUF4931 domain-containing protein [Candidatus Woesearchaeota archaeon]|nr:DUF4931 domain-containing protein [Candidatus Woesearchaeota archaeon]
MSELRKDYFLERWSLVAPARQSRPNEFRKKEDRCFFCPGNEELTPREIFRIEKGDQWQVRVFPNKFGAVDAGGVVAKGALPAKGNHEVIAETPDHKKQLHELSVEDVTYVLHAYINRLSSLKNAYTLIFKNSGPGAGTSIQHSHSQVLSYNKVPTLVEEKLRANKKACQYCLMLKEEMKSARKCFETENFIALAPFASRVSYEVWILPKKHLQSLVDVEDLRELAGLLKKLLAKVAAVADSYNYYLHVSPPGKDLHFSVEILPRKSQWAGFELGTSEYIISVTPEEAAEFYRK